MPAQQVQLYVATDGNSNNSGSGRTVQASGTGAVTNGVDGVVDVSNGSPELGNIEEGATIRLIGNTEGYNGTDVFFVVSYVEEAYTITVDPIPDADTQSWIVGGEVPSLDKAMKIVRKDEDFDVTNIWMKKGTYTSKITVDATDVHAAIWVAGTATSGVHVAGYKTTPGDADGHWGDDDYRAIIDGDAESLASGIRHYSSTSGYLYYTFSHIVVRRCSSYGFDPNATNVDVRCVDCKSELNGHGYSAGYHGVLVGCEALNNTGYGARLRSASIVLGGSYHDNGSADGQLYLQDASCTVLFATIYGLPSNGVGINKGEGRAQVHGCTIDGETGNSTVGIHLYHSQGQSIGLITNCIIYDCVTGIKGDGDSATQIGVNNLFYANGTNRDGWREGIGAVEADPQFVDAASHDYRLKSDSPAVAAGYPAFMDIGAVHRLPWSAGAAVNLGTQDMRLFQKSESVAARRDLFIQMVDETDNVTPKTGLTLAVQIGKAGGSSYADIAGSSSEVGNGTYKISLSATDLDTEGESMLKITATSAAPQYVPIRVVRFLDEVHLAKAALVNARAHTIDTGVDVIKDDDGETTLRTLTPSESEGVVTVTPS